MSTPVSAVAVADHLRSQQLILTVSWTGEAATAIRAGREITPAMAGATELRMKLAAFENPGR